MRSFPLGALGLCAALGAAACWIPRGGSEAAAGRLHQRALVVVSHVDTTPFFEDPDWDFGDRHPTETHVDLPRLREGGVDAVFWSIYLPRRDAPGDAVREAQSRIDAVHRLVERHSAELALATSAAELRRAAAQRRIASLMGMEGGHIIEESLDALRDFHRRGVRYLTLTHSFHTSWADSSGTSEDLVPANGGLGPFGARVVAEMNRLGMMVDVSHASDATALDALRASRAPLIASHSSCLAVTPHRRNLSDELLRALAARGGVVLLNFAYIDAETEAASTAFFAQHRTALEALRAPGLPLFRQQRRMRDFLNAHPPPRPPLESLLRHFDHAIEVAGADHVGIGTDWDGVPSMPAGLDDAAALPILTRELLARGHSPATVEKVLGANLLRVMEEVERVARDLQRAA